MVKYKQKKVQHIISGYINQIISNEYIPADVVQLIHEFFNVIFLFDTYNAKGTNIITKCKEMMLNCESYFFMDNTDALCVYGDNVMGNLGIENQRKIYSILKHEFFEDKMVDVITEGMSNDHNFIYTKNQELYGFGWIELSQLFIDERETIQKPELIKYDFDGRLTQIKCGQCHSLFLTENGNLFGCGSNGFNQLTSNHIRKGHSKVNIEKIIDTKNIIHIECCIESSYIVYNDNRLASFGNNNFGLLGINDSDIYDSGDINIICQNINKISCGYQFMGYLADNNDLYLFGLNNRGQCGYIGHERSTGNQIESINNDTIIDVKCGGSHCIIKTNKNEFYSFGHNTQGQLLLNIKDESIHTPTLISYKYVHKLTGSSNMILDFVPSYESTLIVQRT